MAPMSFPHGEHPDGDPFAEADKQRHANSTLGRLEAKALAEQAALEKQQSAAAGQQSPASNRATVPPPTRSASLRSSRNTLSLYSSQNGSGASGSASKKNLDMVVLEDSEDDAQEAEKVAAQITGRRSAPVSSSSKSTGKGPTTRKHARAETQEDVAMVEAEQPEPQRARTTSPSSAAPAAAPVAVPHVPAIPALARADSSNSLSSLPSSRATTPVAENNATSSPSRAAGANVEGSKMSTVGQEVDKIIANATTRSPLEVPVNMPAGAQPAPARARAKSPPVAPAPKPKPAPRTIRLELKLPTPGTATEVPQYNVDELATEAGYTEEPEEDEDKEGDESEGEEGDSEESDGDGGKKKKDSGKEKEKEKEDDKMEGVEGSNGDPAAPPAPKRRKRGPNVVQGRHGGYDVDDPFVDDTEIELYEPKHYVPAARPGFFVCTGEVEVETKRHRGRQAGSKNKPKFDANGNAIAPTRKKAGADATPGASSANGPSTPMDGQPALPAFGSTGPLPPPPKPKKPERTGPHSFSAELQAEIDALKVEVAAEDFGQKGKFPPRLRPLLVNVAHKAIELDEYDEDFFAILPKIFPYNLFTMKKLVKREVFAKRIADLTAQQTAHIDVVRRGVNDSLAKQKADYDDAHSKWVVEKAAFDAEAGSRHASRAGTPDASGGPSSFVGAAPLAAISGSGTPGSSRPGPEGTSPAPGGAKEEDGPPEPKWKFKFSEPMRMAVLHAVELDDEMTNLITEKQELEKAVEKGEKQHSAINARKNLYAKINALWPTGDMTTNQLSREMSAAKNKLKKKNESLNQA